MFGTIRRHQTWLWAVIITGTIVSFVVWFSPDAQWGGGGRRSGGLGSIDGKPVTETDFRQAYAETRLLYFLNFQKWPENDERARQMDFDVEQQALLRLVRLAKAKAENIQVSDETVGMLAQRLLGPKTPLDGFVREILLPAGLTEADFERFLRHDAVLQQLGAVAGLSGRLIPPRDVEASYREEHEELALEAVVFSVSNYLTSVKVNEPEMLSWYSNSMALFRVPEKARVSYVSFARSNFLADADKEFAKVTNLNAQIEQAYLRNPEGLTDDAGKPLPKDKALEKIKETERGKVAMLFAARRANEFASKVYDEKDHRVEAFEKFATAQGLTVRVSEPFDERTGPSDFEVGEDFVRLAFALTNKEEAVAFQPAPGADGFYVFAVKERLPSSNPSLENMRTNVVERYRLVEAQKLVRQAGMAFQTKVTNGLAQGKGFAALATESQLKPLSLPPISRAMRQAPTNWPAGLDLRQLQYVAFNLQTNKASTYMPSMEGGFIVYMRGKLPFNETVVRTNLPQYAAAIAAQRQNEAVGAWFEAQRRSGVDLPLTTREQRAGGGRGGRAPAPKASTPAPKTK